MVEIWLMEFLKGIGKVFLNPLLYWSFLLIIIAGYRRIKRERYNFGTKVFDIFLEWKDTWKPSVLFGILISLLTLGAGMVFTYETILLLSVITILLSLNIRFTLLSASYTIGVTYVVLLFSPMLERQSYLSGDLFTRVSWTSLTVLLGILLIVEAVLLRHMHRNETHPDLAPGRRGIWTGFHHVRKVNMIPFFVLVPAGGIIPFADYWPYFSIGGETYSVLLVPFLIGFQHQTAGDLPVRTAKRIGAAVALLGMIVVALAAGSIFQSWLSLVAVFVAIAGREYINYRHRMKEKHRPAYFLPGKQGLKVLGVIPGTPGERTGVLAGETLVKVNGRRIRRPEDIYASLQESGAFFKMDVLDDAGEIRFLQGAFYEGDHHGLGLIFSGTPYRRKWEAEKLTEE